MNCLIFHLNTSEIITPSIKRVIESDQVAGNNKLKAITIAYGLEHHLDEVVKIANQYLESINSDLRLNYSEDNKLKTIEELKNYNFNQLSAIFNRYYRVTNENVKDYAAIREGYELRGFENQIALEYGKNYTANRIRINYLKHQNESIEKIFDITKNEIKDEYYGYVLPSFIKIKESEIENNSDKLTDEEKILSSKLIELKKLNNELIQLQNDFKNAAAENKKEINDLLKAKAVERNAFLLNFIEIFGTTEVKNYTALYNQVMYNYAIWFTEVKSLATVNKVSQQFSKLDVDDIYEVTDFDDAIDFENAEQDRNEDNGWDKGKVANSYKKLIDSNFQIYLGTVLYKLDSPYTTGENEIPNYSRNNPLGVKENYDGENLYIQLIKNVKTIDSFNSIESLIEKLTKMATEIPEFYGIMPMIVEMKNNPVFARNIYRNLAHYKVKKATVKINPETNQFEFSRSNNDADAVNKEYLRLRNDYTINFLNVSSELQEKISKLNISENMSNEEKIKLIGPIIDFFRTIAPNYNFTAISDFIENAPYADVLNLLHHVKQLSKEIDRLYKKYSNGRDKFNKEYSEYREKRRAFDKEMEDLANNVIKSTNLKSPIRPTFSLEETIDIENEKSIKASLITITKLLTSYNTTTIDLNSPNANGNNSSNLIANSHISNLFEAIKESSLKGSRTLIRRYGNLSQIEENPFFYGLKDRKGRIIRPGLFIKDNEGNIVVNENFKKYFDIFLFDGIQKTDYSQSVTYQSATKSDYFFTQLLAFFNGINQPGTEEKGLAFFLDTPSDAQKNYIMSVPPIKTDDIFSYDGKDSVAVAKFISLYNNKVTKINELAKTDFEYELNNKLNRLGEQHNFDKSKFFRTLIGKNNDTYRSYAFSIKNSNGVSTVPIIYKEGDTTFYLEMKIEYVDNSKKIFKFSEINNLYVLKNKFLEDTLTDTFVSIFKNNIIENEIEENSIERKINKNSEIFLGYKQLLKSELYNYIHQLGNVIETEDNDKVGGNNWKIAKSKKGLINLVHRKGNKIIENGKLVGNFFRFDKLFKIGNFDVDSILNNKLSLYGDVNTNSLFYTDDKDNLYINEDSDIIKLNINKKGQKVIVDFKYTEEIDNILDDVVSDWLMEFQKDTTDALNEYSNVLDINLKKLNKTNLDVVNFVLATTYIRLATEPIITGDNKFYNKWSEDDEGNRQDDIRTFLKRAKEVQAGGQVYYGGDIYEQPGTDIHNLKYNGKEELITTSNIKVRTKDENGKEKWIIKQVPIYARNGFRAITIENTVKTSEQGDIIKKQLQKTMDKKVADGIVSKSVANRLVNYLSDAFTNAKTKVNDAQSYITFEEWIRRRYADGTYNEYKDLIETINKLRSKEITLADVDINSINKRIQVQKNFYFDIQTDKKTGTMYPRQIKNAEFVLIPELLVGTDLEKLYNAMVEAGIDQVNTIETSKAANRDILTFWDNNQKVVNYDEFISQISSPLDGDNRNYNYNVVEDYYYRNLWKQQDVAEHTKDEVNKAGLQITKKIIDNATEDVDKFVNAFITNFSTNIKASYDQMLFNMGWMIDKNTGRIVNRSNGKELLDFREFYIRALQEAERLGMDSNFKEYFEIDETAGYPKMPNFMNINSEKQESVTQALFNSSVRKQTLPGWHMAQVSGVGTGVRDTTGKIRTLKYHSDEKGNYVPYIEVLIPRWSMNIPKYKRTPKKENESNDVYYTRIEKEQQKFDEEILKKLNDAKLLEHIGYRIPTEGKQSVAIMKVVGFVDDIYGSTIFVPNEWVTQTGSDFDVDSIYGICHNFRYNEKTKNFEKINENNKDTQLDRENRYIAYIKQLIKNGRIKTLQDTLNKDNKLLNEEKRNNISNILKDINNIQAKLQNTDYFKNNYKQQNELIQSLPANIKEMISRNMKKINDAYGDLEIRDKHYIEQFKIFLKSPKINPQIKSSIQELIDIINDRKAITNELNNISDNWNRIESEKESYHAALLSAINDLANEYNLIKYDEFIKLPILEQQIREARNNNIIDNFLEILKNDSSFEENMSRSNFDDITAVNKTISKLEAIKSKHNQAVANTLTQIQFFEDAIMGARLKALSVQRDTFLSVSNKIHGKLKTPILVAYDLNQQIYNSDKKSYEDIFEGETLKDKKDNLKSLYNEYRESNDDEYIVAHDELGWHSHNGKTTNRNILGRLMTVYSSETTAHILDAVKEGAIINETEDTFGIFKTLIDLGIDYSTAIGFLAQPAITKLVKNFNNNKSIYINDNNNAIVETMVQILNEAGYNEVSNYSDLKTVIKKGKEFFKLSDENIINVKDLYNALNGNDTLLHQFQVLSIYSQLNGITKNIENLVQCCNPDKFGAKQTIHDTKEALINIYNYGFNANNDAIFEITNDKDIPFLQSLYPGLFERSGLREKDSSYEYLASFLKYTTIPSVVINSQLFDLESPEFSLGYYGLVELFNDNKTFSLCELIEHKLGRRLTNDEYKEYKKYIVSSVFNENKTLVTPLIVDKYNRFIPDIENLDISEKNTENDANTVTPHANYWNREKMRIFGFGVQGYRDIKVNNIEKPTKEEIKAFSKLTPAQKVDWIKLHFRNNAEIFNYIETNYISRGSYSLYGVNINSLKVKFGNDVEILYSAFRKAAFSKNPLIKLAAADLVKYAFIVEGDNFKFGGISRIITNDFLYTSNNDYGFTINPNYSFVEELSSQLHDIDIREKSGNTFIERFIRQHHTFIKELNLNTTISKDTNSSEKSIFYNSTNSDRSVLIKVGNKNSPNQSLIKKILGSDQTKGFVKIKSKNDKIELYKVERIEIENALYGIYLYPIGILEENEYNDYSVKEENNPLYKHEYYETQFKDIIKVLPTVDLDKYKYENRATAEDKVENYKIPVYAAEKMENDEFQQILNGEKGDESSKKGIEMFIEQITDFIKTPVEGDDIKKYTVAATLNPYLMNLFKENTSIIQDILVDGELHTIIIKPYKRKNLESLKRILRDNAISGKKKYTSNKAEDNLIDYLFKNKFADKHMLLSVEIGYKTDEELNEAVKEEDNERKIKAAVTNLLIDEDDVSRPLDSKVEPIDKFAGELAKRMYNRSKRSDNSIIQRFARKVSTGELIVDDKDSVIKNKRNIFVSAASYYEQEANLLLDRMKHYVIGEGENKKDFNIGNPNLYEELLKYPEYYDDLVALILNAKNFGRDIGEVFSLDVEVDDEIINKSIETIRKSINLIRNNNLLNGENGAISNIFNIYIAKKYSNNPLIRHDLIKLRTQFGDINWFDLQIADAGFTNNKQIQTVLKLVYGIIDRVRDIEAPDAVREFQEKYDNIMKSGNIDMNKIIDEHGKYIQKYNDKYFEDKQTVIDNYIEAMAKYGKYSEQALKAKLERDEWFAKNVEQLLVKEYYDAINEATRRILYGDETINGENAINYFIEYNKLKDELSGFTYDASAMTESDIKRIKEIHSRLSELTQETKGEFDTTEDGEIISMSSDNIYIDRQAQILNHYIKSLKEINSKYKEYEPTDSWVKTIRHYLDIISEFDKLHPGLSLNAKLENPSYKEAYVWVNKNSIYSINEKTLKEISKNYEILRGSKHSTFKNITIWCKRNGFVDEFGRIDGRKLSLEQQRGIKNAMENSKLRSNASILSDDALINQVRFKKPIYKDKFYLDVYGGEHFSQNADKLEKIKEINKIFVNANAVTSKGIDMILLLSHLNIEELRNLRDKINELREIKGKKLPKDIRNRLKALTEKVTDNESFKADYLTVKSHFQTSEPAKFAIWLQMFVEHDSETGDLVMEDNTYVPEYLFYGYRSPIESQKDKYIDKEKTAARNFIDENIEYVTNEYYKEAWDNAVNNGAFEEWFEANHIYNQFTKRYETIPIWSNMRIKNEVSRNKYEYIPTFDNSERNPRHDDEVDYRNPNYKTYGSHFKEDTADKKYINEKYSKANLNDNEIKMLNFLINTARKYVINNGQRSFADTYAPRLMEHRADKKFRRNVVLDILGVNYRSSANDKWHEEIGYLYDSDPDFQMFELLKNEGYKERVKARPRNEGETDEQYSKYLNDIKKENEEIHKNNLELDSAMLNRNWREVYSQLVLNGENYLARNKAKNSLYLLLEDLLENDAIKGNRITGKPIVNKNSSNNPEMIKYLTEKQEHAFKIMQTFARRVIYDEYKKQHKLTGAANLLQGFTSSKYMMLNIHGGIANVSTGLVNILAERFAGEYFSNKAWWKAEAKYGANVLSAIADMYYDDASSFTNGLIKLINAVDYDEINGELVKSATAVEFARRLNDFLFSPNSMGEHFMQNTAALAMIEDARIYEDGNGGYRIGNINDYMRDIEIETLKEIITEWGDSYKINSTSIITLFNNYIKNIKKDKKVQYDYDTFKKDICMDFIQLITRQANDNSKLANEYIKRRKSAIEKAKKEFETKDRLIDQFEFKLNKNGDGRGVTRIKHDSKLNINPSTGELDSTIGNTTFKEFTRRIIYVNKKIHGVYDKLGRATIENEFWGSLVMQYHKHIYPGIMKRYRGIFGGGGYYNELLEGVEMGSYTSLLRFLSTEFRNLDLKKKQIIDENGNIVDTDISALESLQNIAHAFIATITHISLNWNLLPAWEQRNILRAIGDIAGIIGTALLVIGMYAMWDDEDFKDDLLLANTLYTANRMFSEAYMYLPTGMISEFDSLWASPVAGSSNIKDIMKGFEILSEILFNDDFNPKYTTGQYKGRYKLEVLATRNIPVYRIYKNILNMGARNSYYNGGTGNSKAQAGLREIGKSLKE